MSGLLRSNVVVASGTALSRITGFLRLTVLLYVLGQSALSDAYLIANETPNIVYDLLLGGLLSATLVPLFSTFVETDDDESTNVVITVAVAAMAVLTTIAVAAAPLIFGLYSFNIAADVDPDVFRSVGTTLARIFLIQIFFYGLVGLANAFLNSRRRFFAAAWAPILPNLIIVSFLLSLPNPGSAEWQLAEVLTNDRLRWTLGLGATVGIAAMAAVLVPAMLATGFSFRPRFDLRHPAVRKLLSLSFWTIGFVVANQVALVVIRNLAEPGSSDASAYITAFTFFVLPHGLLAVSIATTFQPEMSRSVARRDRTAFVDQSSLGLRMTALFTIPAGVGMFVLREPIIGALLQRGQFDLEDADAAQRALAGFAPGLAAFSIYMFVLRGFYAHKDTKTPFKINVAENLINIGLAIVLVDRYGVLGLGLAFALAYMISSLWALQILSYKVPGFSVGAILRSLAPMLLAAVLMAEAVWLATQPIGGNTGVGAILRIGVGTLVGVGVYGAVLVALRVPELDPIRRRLRRT
ncbi:MAG TPA: murein biosynthesis integral membrane protein MurJ [Ilumatobacteraceae bacterium]|nr:murein biosynthesis integral membrane protein MurJ [Ilumatobacteraceae bacterium]